MNRWVFLFSISMPASDPRISFIPAWKNAAKWLRIFLSVVESPKINGRKPIESRKLFSKKKKPSGATKQTLIGRIKLAFDTKKPAVLLPRSKGDNSRHLKQFDLLVPVSNLVFNGPKILSTDLGCLLSKLGTNMRGAAGVVVVNGVQQETRKGCLGSCRRHCSVFFAGFSEQGSV